MGMHINKYLSLSLTLINKYLSLSLTLMDNKHFTFWSDLCGMCEAVRWNGDLVSLERDLSGIKI